MKVLIIEEDPAIRHNYGIFAGYCDFDTVIGEDAKFLEEHWDEVEACDTILISIERNLDGIACLQFLAEHHWKKPVLLQCWERWWGPHHLIDLKHIRHTYPFATFKKKQWDGYNFMKFLESLSGKAH